MSVARLRLGRLGRSSGLLAGVGGETEHVQSVALIAAAGGQDHPVADDEHGGAALLREAQRRLGPPL